MTQTELAKEIASSGDYFKTLCEKLIAQGVAFRIQYKNTNYWIPIFALAEEKKENLEAWVINEVIKAEKEKAKQDIENKTKLKKDFLENRETAVANLFLECPNCGKKHKASGLYHRSALSTEKNNITGYAGSQTCQCGCEVFFTQVITEHNANYIQSTNLKEALRLGITKTSFLDHELISKNYNEKIHEIENELKLGLSGNFSFWNRRND